MEAVNPVQLTLEPNTQHVVFSEFEYPPDCPVDLAWKTILEQEIGVVVEMVLARLENEIPQRVSVPGLQVFVGIVERQVLEETVCKLIQAAKGTPHVVSVPTFRYIPSGFLYWDDCAALNRLIWSKSVDVNVPVLNLHKSFLGHQTKEWIVVGPVYSEFTQDLGLGSTLNESGMTRYTSRLYRFHQNGFSNAAPSVIPPECRPLELWRTFSYTENPETAEFLGGLGYPLAKRALVKAEAKSRKKAVQAKAKVKAVPMVSVDVVPMDVDVPEKEGVAKVEPEPVKSNKGKRQRPNIIHYNRPAAYSLISIDRETFRSMIKDNGDLRQDLKKVSSVLVANDEEIKHLKKDCERFERQAIVAKARCREVKRLLAKSGDEAIADNREWKEHKADLEHTIREYEWECEEYALERKRFEDKVEAGVQALEAEREKVKVLTAKMTAWEDYVRRRADRGE